MDITAKKAIDLISNSNNDSQIKGLDMALKEKLYSVLPNTIKLVSSSEKRVADYAINVSLSLAKECLLSRDKSGIQPVFISTAVSIIKKLSPDFAESLFKKLDSDNPETIINAIIALKHFIKEDDAKAILARFVMHPNNKVRATTVLHIGPLASRVNADVLGKFLMDTDNRIKANTIEVVEQLKNKNLFPIISRFRNDENNRIRGNALKALYTLNKIDIYKDLETMLTSEEPLMRATGIWLIGELGNKEKRYIKLLKIVMDDNDKLLRDNLVIAMKKIGNIPQLEFLRIKLKDFIKDILKTNIIKSTELKLKQIPKKDYLLLKLTGSITTHTILSLKIQIDEFINKNLAIVMDFQEVSYIDSSGIGLILNLSKKMESKKGFLFICNCKYAIKELFEITKIDQKLNLFQSEEEIQSFICLP